MLTSINTIVVRGSGSEKSAKIHFIQLSPIKSGTKDFIFPSLGEKEIKRLTDTISKIRGMKAKDQLYIRIDLNIDKDPFSHYQEFLTDLRSLELSIGIAIHICDDANNNWHNKWQEWCFSGVIHNLDCTVGKVDSINVKINAALIHEKIRFIMVPYDNKQEVINWAKERKLKYKEILNNNLPNTPDEKSVPLLKKIVQLTTRHTLARIALILWFLSLSYIPIRYLYWNSLLSWKAGAPRVTIQLPTANVEEIKNLLLKNGFPEAPVNSSPISRLTKINQKGKASITLRGEKFIEFEIIDQNDLSFKACYFCAAYAVIFACSVVIFSLNKRNLCKNDSKKAQFHSIVIPDSNKEIFFVKNLKEAETIVKERLV